MGWFRKTVLGVLIGGFMASTLAAICTDMYYYAELPKVPDPTTQRTHQMVVSHGSVRYGSQGELHWLQGVERFFPIGAILIVPAALLGLGWGVFRVGPTGPQKETPSKRSEAQ